MHQIDKSDKSPLLYLYNTYQQADLGDFSLPHRKQGTMKKILLFAAMALSIISGNAQSIKGDLNNDGIVDISDVNHVLNIMVGKAAQEITYTVNGVSFTMVQVNGGTFTMGATEEQDNEGGSREKPAHQVTLSSFCMGQTEVTQALWLAVMGNNPSNFQASTNEHFETNLQRPVERVSWDDCQAFIAKLNELTGQNFRLPTEAEWEYAARGGNRSMGNKYAGSNTIDDVAWYWDNIPSQNAFNAGYGTQPVATKSPNELGLYDMSGNVNEWCQDWYGSYNSETQTNPTGPESGSNRVARGGSWSQNATFSRVAARLNYTPSTTANLVGLRLALQLQ